MAIAETQRLLIVRPHDLVVLSVRCRGFDQQGPSLLAGGEGGLVELTLPPQATGEQAYSGATVQARLSAPARVTFAVDPDTVLPLDADGLLAALATARWVSDGTPLGLSPAAVELPWGLVLAPRPRVAGDPMRFALPARAVAADDGATGLWHLRAEAAGGLALDPLGVSGDDADLMPPLDRMRRDRIDAEARSTTPSPSAPSVDLSALGGSMTAAGSWPTFSWRQETVLGRDLAMRTETKGFLFPFWHRAVLVNDVERVMDPETGQATAGLIQRLTLTVTEPLRAPAADGHLARAFPFGEVELLERTFVLDGEEVPERYARVAKDLQGLRDRLDADRQTLADAEAQIGVELEQARADAQASAQTQRDEIAGTRVAIADELASLEAADAAFQAFRPPPPPPERPPEIIDEFGGSSSVESTETTDADLGPPPLTPQEFARMQELRGFGAELDRQAGQVETDLQNALAAFQTEEGIAGSPTVQTARALRESVPLSEAHVAEVSAATEPRLAVWEWPLAGGRRLQVPVRCGDVRTALPLLFVQEIDLPEDDDFERFAPLADDAVLSAIETAWSGAGAGVVELPGLPVALVRDGGPPKPADVLPVHQLTLAPRRDPAGGYRAVVAEVKAELAAVRALVPGHDELTRLTFDERYLRDGVADQFGLRLPDGLPVDFTRFAAQSGGLVSPAFTADVLSRLDGPVDLRSLGRELLPGELPDPPDLSEVFRDATLLGISLGDLIERVEVPRQLSIVPDPSGGAKMTWSELRLRSHGPLKVRPDTSFVLTVVQTPSVSETTCRLERFALALPPSGSFLTLRFRSLTFTQRAGRPPDLDVDGLEVELGGALDLLKTLQQHVDLGKAAPKVESAPNGIRAGYALALAEVAAGMFTMRNIAFTAGVEVPFDGRPVVASLGFATPEDPFNLSVSAFGGGGYLVFEIAQEGVRRLEASLDFGATVAIGVGIATAEVHALGGVRFQMRGEDVQVTGFLRIGGSVDVLGLISVSVELRVELSFDGHVLAGRATAVIEVDVTFWSGSVELDSGTYVFAGATAEGSGPSASIDAAPPPEPQLSDWQRYRDAFQRVPA